MESLKDRQEREQAAAAKALSRLGLGEGFDVERGPRRQNNELIAAYRLKNWDEFVIALQWSLINLGESIESRSALNALLPAALTIHPVQRVFNAPPNLTERREWFRNRQGVSLSTLLRAEQKGFRKLDQEIRRTLNSLSWKDRVVRGKLTLIEMQVEDAVRGVIGQAQAQGDFDRQDEFLEAVLSRVNDYKAIIETWL